MKFDCDAIMDLVAIILMFVIMLSIGFLSVQSCEQKFNKLCKGSEFREDHPDLCEEF